MGSVKGSSRLKELRELEGNSKLDKAIRYV